MTMLMTLKATCNPWLVLAGLGPTIYKPEVSRVPSMYLISLIESVIEFKEMLICLLIHYLLVHQKNTTKDKREIHRVLEREYRALTPSPSAPHSRNSHVSSSPQGH